MSKRERLEDANTKSEDNGVEDNNRYILSRRHCMPPSNCIYTIRVNFLRKHVQRIYQINNYIHPDIRSSEIQMKTRH